jgi:predicted TIM-barrel fold metal-dependent hydrolase
MWGSDYPHPEGTWPRSAEYLAAQMEVVPDDVRRAVLWQNAARLYGIRLPAEAGITTD